MSTATYSHKWKGHKAHNKGDNQGLYYIHEGDNAKAESRLGGNTNPPSAARHPLNPWHFCTVCFSSRAPSITRPHHKGPACHAGCCTQGKLRQKTWLLQVLGCLEANSCGIELIHIKNYAIPEDCTLMHTQLCKPSNTVYAWYCAAVDCYRITYGQPNSAWILKAIIQFLLFLHYRAIKQSYTKTSSWAQLWNGGGV